MVRTPRRLFVRVLVLRLCLAAQAAAESPAPAPPPPVKTASDAPRILVTPALARNAIAAALRASGQSELHRYLGSMATRARWSAAVPEVWLRAARSTDQSLRVTPTTDDPYHYSEGGGVGLWLEARLVWHLDRLVFDHDELSVERFRMDRAEGAAKLANRVLETLFAWQRAAWRAEDGASSEEDRQAALLKRLESEVTLDVLTNGWFGSRRAAATRQ
jgi:hypothetical protein